MNGLVIIIVIITVILVLIIYTSSKTKKSNADSNNDITTIDVNFNNSTNAQLDNSQVNVVLPIIPAQQADDTTPGTKDLNGTVNNNIQQDEIAPTILVQQSVSSAIPSVVISSKLSNSTFFTFPDLTSTVYPGVWCYGNHYPTGISQKTVKKPYAVEGSGFMLTHFFLDVPVLSTGSSITCYISKTGSVVSFTPIPIDSSYIGSFTVSLVPDGFSESSIKPEFRGKTKIIYRGNTKLYRCDKRKTIYYN